MKKPDITVAVTKEKIGYSANTVVKGNFIGTEADSFATLKSSIVEAINFTFEEQEFVYSFDELIFEYDLNSFFHFYKVINAKALSKRIGMNQSLLSQYINGIKKPSSRQTKRILQGVYQIGKELSEVQFFL